MEAMIKVTVNGYYIVTLVDPKRGMVGIEAEEFVFKKDDLQGAFRAIDKFFLDGRSLQGKKGVGI